MYQVFLGSARRRVLLGDCVCLFLAPFSCPVPSTVGLPCDSVVSTKLTKNVLVLVPGLITVLHAQILAVGSNKGLRSSLPALFQPKGDDG